MSPHFDFKMDYTIVKLNGNFKRQRLHFNNDLKIYLTLVL